MATWLVLERQLLKFVSVAKKPPALFGGQPGTCAYRRFSAHRRLLTGGDARRERMLPAWQLSKKSWSPSLESAVCLALSRPATRRPPSSSPPPGGSTWPLPL